MEKVRPKQPRLGFEQVIKRSNAYRKEAAVALKIGSVLFCLSIVVWIIQAIPYVHDSLICTQIVNLDASPDHEFSNGKEVIIEGRPHIEDKSLQYYIGKPVIWYKQEKQAFVDSVINRVVIEGNPDDIEPGNTDKLKLINRQEYVKAWKTIEDTEKFYDFRMGNIVVSPCSSSIYLKKKIINVDTGFDLTGNQTRIKISFVEAPEKLTVSGNIVDGVINSGENFRIGLSRSQINLSEYSKPPGLVSGFLFAFIFFMIGVAFDKRYSFLTMKDKILHNKWREPSMAMSVYASVVSSSYSIFVLYLFYLHGFYMNPYYFYHLAISVVIAVPVFLWWVRGSVRQLEYSQTN